MGDFVKGRNLRDRYAPTVALGIELHREIDVFTDGHREVKESKNRLRPKYRHYAGVIVDMFYDHFLAAHWTTYSKQPLHLFVQESYSTIQSFEHILPDQLQYMLRYMVRDNWLLQYANFQGIDRALTGMAQRTPFVSKMEQAVGDLQLHYQEYQAEFTRFYPDVMHFSATWLQSKLDKN